MVVWGKGGSLGAKRLEHFSLSSLMNNGLLYIFPTVDLGFLVLSLLFIICHSF